MDNEPKKFSEQRVFEYFKKVRNRIKIYYPESIVFQCILKLNDKNKNIMQFPDWFLFLLIKWSLLYGDFIDSNRRKLTIRDFNYLINLMHELFNVQRGPNDYENFQIFFRTSGHPQFWLQENLPINRLGRQVLLFYHLEKNHSFNKYFYSKYNIYISEYIELLYMLYTRFINNKEIYIELNWFRNIFYIYSSTRIQNFLDSISKDLFGLKHFFENEEKFKNVSYEFHEQTSIKRYPL